MHNHVCIFVCYVSICLQSPSNQRFYRKITGYGMSVGDHRVALMMKGDHGQTTQLHVYNAIQYVLLLLEHIM